MAHGLELRVPLIDHKLAESIFAMPGGWKLSASTPKPVLVNAVNDLPLKSFIAVSVDLRCLLNIGCVTSFVLKSKADCNALQRPDGGHLLIELPYSRCGVDFRRRSYFMVATVVALCSAALVRRAICDRLGLDLWLAGGDQQKQSPVAAPASSRICAEKVSTPAGKSGLEYETTVDSATSLPG